MFYGFHFHTRNNGYILESGTATVHNLGEKNETEKYFTFLFIFEPITDVTL